MAEPNDTRTALTKRRPLLSPDFRRRHPAARAFLAPQRERAAPKQHPKPRCGMCGGKVHTKTDYRAPDEGSKLSRGLGGWWLCPACDTGAEVGMPRAA